MALLDWIGAALAVAQVTRITFSAYTSGQTYTLTINGKSVSYVAAASTSADVFAGLVAAWGATLIAEFKEATASVNSGVVLTANVAGVPFTVTATATGGITSTITTLTACTGPNFRTNAANYLGGAAPGAGDHTRFRNGNVPMLYDLEDVAVNYGDIIIEASYTGSIGLPAVNPLGYREYRPRFLKLGNGSNNYKIRIGAGQGQQPARILIDANAATVFAQVYGTGTALDGERPLVIKNTDATSTLEYYGGIATLDADSSGAAATLKVIANPQAGAQCNVLVTEQVACGVVTTSGGELEIRGSATSVDANLGSKVSISGDATCPTVVASSGSTVFWDSTAGVTNATARPGGTIDFGRQAAAKTVTNGTCHKDGKFLDPLGILTLTNGVILSGCTVQECVVDIGRNRTLKT